MKEYDVNHDIAHFPWMYSLELNDDAWVLSMSGFKTTPRQGKGDVPKDEDVAALTVESLREYGPEKSADMMVGATYGWLCACHVTQLDPVNYPVGIVLEEFIRYLKMKNVDLRDVSNTELIRLADKCWSADGAVERARAVGESQAVGVNECFLAKHQ